MKKIYFVLFVIICFVSCKTVDISTPVVSESQQLFDKLEACVAKNDVDNLKRIIDDTPPKFLRSVIDLVSVNNGRTLLHMAVWDENPEIIKLLLNNGASKTIKDRAGKTAVDYAKKTENEKICEIMGVRDIVEKKNVITKDEDSQQKTLAGFTDNGIGYTVVFGATDSKLLRAVKEQNYGEVKKLLDSNTNVNVTDILGNNALFYVINTDNGGILNLLLSYNINCNAQNIRGQLPFLYAVEKGNRAIISDLLKAGASINKSDSAGVTAELIAVNKKDASLLKFLASEGAYLSSKDSDGNTLLHRAVINEDLVTVKYLLDKDCDIWATNNSGISVLDIMRDSKHSGIQAMSKDYE